jgi:6-phospho-beta-glucosidase
MGTRTKVVVLGGSALATPSLFQVIGKREPRGAYEFVLYGRNAERLALVRKVSEAITASFPDLDITFSNSTQLEAALEGAEFCINQIRAGGLEGRAFDESFPRQFGIPGEETVGPGGFSSSLRGIPAVLDICRSIERYAPEALVLNLTNPSSIIQYAIRRYTSVQVIGTCDSPVWAMENIAALLKVSMDDLRFGHSGMHHFGWVAGIQHKGEDVLPIVLRNVEKMSKLGTDPELVQALGVIPSVYFKYYAHPDRILAETQGRKIRAHQLMELSSQMLDDFRRWTPGAPLDMLDRRGAGWYEKIVVPALLALAEKWTIEMTLSVDNDGTLPWLPTSAIVEVPVSIHKGQIQHKHGADLPQDVQAMIAQNCAYEMLAAEAIAERDRGKAVRALMSNLMVNGYDQARGILDLVWPREAG